MGEGGTTSRVTHDRIPDELSADRVHAVLASAERRQVLVELCRADTSVPLHELAGRLAGVDDPADEVLERAHVRLYHNHVPRLADAGYVEYDEEGDAVELTNRGTVLAELLVE